MSAKILSSLTDENQQLRKQRRCMNTIFQFFDYHHLIKGQCISSHNQNRLLLGAQHQSEPLSATKAVKEKIPEVQKEKPRVSTGSPQASYSSSSSSSKFSSLDTATREQKPSLAKGPQSSDIRDVVKDSMYREARGLSIKSTVNNERKLTIVKHIDSPRPRSSYDGRESRDMTMKLDELPRLSLDSRASSIMYCSPLESRLSFLGGDPHMENENQAPGSHSRSSSIVAKLMGLDSFPDPSPSPRLAFRSESSTTAEESKKNQVSQESYAKSSSPRLHNANSVRRPILSSRVPTEPAPWKQRDSSQGSPKMAAQSEKASKNTANPSSSVYGEIEKRIAELEFKRSDKDLRALKQILEAMQKTRERLENQRGESAKLTMQDRKTYEQVQAIKDTSLPKRGGSCIERTKSAKVMEQAKLSSSMHLQRIQNQNLTYHKENQARRERVKSLTLRNSNKKEPTRHLWTTLEQERTVRAAERMRQENCAASRRDFAVASPRLQKSILKIEGEPRPTTPQQDSGRAKKHSSKKEREKCSQNRKHKVKSVDSQLSDDQLSEFSGETKYSSYQGDTASVKSESKRSEASHRETEVISLVNSINTSSRRQQNCGSTSQHISTVELEVTMMERPSPVSVLDATFYSDDSPSPVKKISMAFRDESPSPDEAAWYLDNPNHLRNCTKSDPDYKSNQKPDNVLHLVHEPRLLKGKPNETAADQNESVYPSSNPDHRYINKILAASGLLKNTTIVPTATQLLSSCRMINTDMFHILEETEDPTEEANEELIKKNDNQKMQRKIVFDAVNEMLVRKITSGRLLTLGRKMSLQGLMKEVYWEMDHLCRMPHCNVADEDDGLSRLLTADMKHQSDDWTEYRGEFPALALDVERLIFKDLINEVVMGEVMGLRDWPRRHCRQLFTK